MHKFLRLDAGHDDVIHDVVYDFYGRRIATCSSDQKIKVWDLEEGGEESPSVGNGEKKEQFPPEDSQVETESLEETPSWVLNDAWKAHDASILKLSWAHPEYGQVIASGGMDRSLRIWEEQEHEPRQSGKRWAERARLLDSRASIRDVEFAPKHQGLKLATCSADGCVRIYEAIDVMNPSSWTLMEEIEVTTNDSKMEQGGNYSLSWCTGRFDSAMFVVACGQEHVAKIYRFSERQHKWCIAAVTPDHQGVIHDVSWAPNIGRSYHLLATAGKDQHVRIWRVRNPTQEGALSSSSTDKNPDQRHSSPLLSLGNLASSETLQVDLLAEFSEHYADVWRVEWNILGTILSSAGDDGKVRLWKANYLNDWKCISVINTERLQTTLKTKS